MLDWLIELDKQFFLFLNGLHAHWLDPIMFFISGKKEWIPFYVALAGALIWKYKWRSVVFLAAVGVGIGLSDQITSGMMKPFFERLRPSHEPTLDGLVHLVNDYKGGHYGFASSHASNTFALAMFFFLTFRRNYPWIRWIFVWAAIVSYSRIYLGVHYPGDILVGAVIGILCGWIGMRIVRWRYREI
ncbi:MAG: phosphatase PAP2 family protein [Cyclobacteriaceae bacterium]|nr:phosphatase PAP2 family protein [Cyclobacteriaceae bacterium]